MTDTLRQDIRNALRILFRSRGFAVAAVIMLDPSAARSGDPGVAV